MPGLRRGKTLFEAVPALGAISAHGTGKARLVPVDFEHPGFELVGGLNKLGRDPAQNHHAILSGHVSRTHCEILVAEGEVWVKDVGSHNGTFVNGERVTQSALRPGDRLGVSRRLTFVLVMDQDLQKPIGMQVNLDAETTRVQPGPEAEPSDDLLSTRPVGDEMLDAAPPATGVARAAPAPVVSVEAVAHDDAELDPAAALKQMEQQRNILAILYQISLHCLMADNQREIEKLLTNVLPRLVPLDSGFILYQCAGVWRASICPSSRQRPTDTLVRAFFQAALDRHEAQVIDSPQGLERLGLSGGSAMIIPLLLADEIRGVVGTISSQPRVYTPEILDIMKQLANVTAAALRDR